MAKGAGRAGGAEGSERWQRPDESEDRAVYIISVAAELAGMHPQTLRIYERKGLLNPARTAGNTRRYSERDIARLQAIQRLTHQHGINLAGVKMVVELENEIEQMRRRMERLGRELGRVRQRMGEELERARSQRPGTEMVPLSLVRRMQFESRTAVRPQEGRAERPRRGPIAVGPGGS